RWPGQARSRPWWGLLRRPLVDFDVGSPRIGDERDAHTDVIYRVRPIKLDVAGLKRLDEGFKVLNVEADVVQDAALGGSLRGFGLVEPQLHARNVRDRSVVALTWLGAENLSVPSLTLGDCGLRQEEMDMLALDRHRLILVFQDFDAQAV